MPGCWVDYAIRYRGVKSELITKMSPKPYLLVAGCSHTEGAGIDKNQTWANVLSTMLDLDLVNLGKSGACAKFVSDSIIQWLTTCTVLPRLIVVQWPNPYRSMEVVNQKICFFNVSNMNDRFRKRFMLDPDSFVDEWHKIIVELNQLYPKQLINICLESCEGFMIEAVKELAMHDIQLHIDQKQPGKTWYFDCGATDGLHHSESCHQKWADRILTIIPT